MANAGKGRTGMYGGAKKWERIFLSSRALVVEDGVSEARGKRRQDAKAKVDERPGGARFNTSSLVRAFTLTSDRQIKLNDTRIVKGDSRCDYHGDGCICTRRPSSPRAARRRFPPRLSRRVRGCCELQTADVSPLPIAARDR